MTEQTTNGNNQSSVDKKHKEIHDTISEYFQQIKLGNLVSFNEVEKYLNLSSVERRKLNPQDAAEAALILAQQATYIQTEINRQHAVAEWCNDQIDGIIGPKIHQYGTQYTPKEYRRKSAIVDSDAATKLESIRLKAMLRVNTLNYLPSYLQKVAHGYEVLSRTFMGREIQ